MAAILGEWAAGAVKNNLAFSSVQRSRMSARCLGQLQRASSTWSSVCQPATWQSMCQRATCQASEALAGASSLRSLLSKIPEPRALNGLRSYASQIESHSFSCAGLNRGPRAITGGGGWSGGVGERKAKVERCGSRVPCMIEQGVRTDKGRARTCQNRSSSSSRRGREKVMEGLPSGGDGAAIARFKRTGSGPAAAAPDALIADVEDLLMNCAEGRQSHNDVSAQGSIDPALSVAPPQRAEFSSNLRSRQPDHRHHGGMAMEVRESVSDGARALDGDDDDEDDDRTGEEVEGLNRDGVEQKGDEDADVEEYVIWRKGGGKVHRLSLIDRSTVVEVGAVVGARARIGAQCRIGTGTVVGEGVMIGVGTTTGFNVALQNCTVGNQCILHNGVCVGQDGFGFYLEEGRMIKKLQRLRVVIGNEVEIGANSCIDRGSWRDTTIGDSTKIDNLVQIGHNVVIGKCCILCGQVGLAGSVTLGDYVVMGGKSGVADHVTVASSVRIASKAGVFNHITEPGDYAGFPATPAHEWRRSAVALRQLGRSARSSSSSPPSPSPSSPPSQESSPHGRANTGGTVGHHHHHHQQQQQQQQQQHQQQQQRGGSKSGRRSGDRGKLGPLEGKA